MTPLNKLKGMFPITVNVTINQTDTFKPEPGPIKATLNINARTGGMWLKPHDGRCLAAGSMHTLIITNVVYR